MWQTNITAQVRVFEALKAGGFIGKETYKGANQFLDGQFGQVEGDWFQDQTDFEEFFSCAEKVLPQE